MRRQPGRVRHPGKSDEMAWIIGGSVLVAAILAVLGLWCVAFLTGVGHGSPFGWVRAASRGQRVWTGWSTTLLIVVLVGLLTAGVFAGRRWLVVRRDRKVIDRLAPHMSGPEDIRPLELAAAEKSAAELNATHVGPGVVTGQSVLRKKLMYAPWEWSQVWLMGTRAGKTTSVCIPQVLGSQGPVLFTENKRTILDAVRGPRSLLGEVWGLDPQQIAGVPPSWRADLLAFVDSIETSIELVDVFVAAVEPADARKDYFTSAAVRLSTNLVLAAAVGSHPITKVWDWLSNPQLEGGLVDPADVLAEHGEAVAASDMRGLANLTPKQRDGVYDGAKNYFGFLRSKSMVEWICPRGEAFDARRVFDPDAFVRSTDTLALLSRESGLSGRAITAALTKIVFRAAEQTASEQGGRLRTPLTCVLDEAANTCRIPDLPDLMSWYGSLGIILSVFFQNPAQGEEAWGRTGFRKIFSTANIATVGRGIRDEDFLSSIARLIKDREILEREVTHNSKGGRSVSPRVRREATLDAADLQAMATGRAIQFTSGTRPVLLKLVHWSDTEHADLIRQSLSVYQPKASVTERVSSSAKEKLRPSAWTATRAA